MGRRRKQQRRKEKNVKVAGKTKVNKKKWNDRIKGEVLKEGRRAAQQYLEGKM